MDELVKRLREKAGAFDYDGRPDIACDYEQAADAIEELTAIREEQKAQIIAMAAEIEEQQPRTITAHWYWDEDGMDWNIGAWRCSACRVMSPMWWNCDRGSPMHKSGHKFCPNCGAKMEES